MGLGRFGEGLGGSWGPFGKFGGGFLGVTWGFLGALVSKTYSGGYFCEGVVLATCFLQFPSSSSALFAPFLAFGCFLVALSCFLLLSLACSCLLLLALALSCFILLSPAFFCFLLLALAFSC